MKNLYSSLIDILYEYEERLQHLILQDKKFDKSEFIMVINCMHGSVEYLNEIFNIEDEIFFRISHVKDQNGECKTLFKCGTLRTKS